MVEARGLCWVDEEELLRMKRAQLAANPVHQNRVRAALLLEPSSGGGLDG